MFRLLAILTVVFSLTTHVSSAKGLSVPGKYSLKLAEKAVKQIGELSGKFSQKAINEVIQVLESSYKLEGVSFTGSDFGTYARVEAILNKIADKKNVTARDLETLKSGMKRLTKGAKIEAAVSCASSSCAAKSASQYNAGNVQKISDTEVLVKEPYSARANKSLVKAMSIPRMTTRDSLIETVKSLGPKHGLSNEDLVYFTKQSVESEELSRMATTLQMKEDGKLNSAQEDFFNALVTIGKNNGGTKFREHGFDWIIVQGWENGILKKLTAKIENSDLTEVNDILKLWKKEAEEDLAKGKKTKAIEFNNLVEAKCFKGIKGFSPIKM
ncbi:MAG: hypothetical protein H6622_13645 [Halobacteriovoraceae bacterium]|nr:hypothetical protein [Halobacteriovoraceae bacterium]